MVLARLGQGQMNFVGWALALSMPEIQFQYMYDVIRTQNDSFSPKSMLLRDNFSMGPPSKQVFFRGMIILHS